MDRDRPAASAAIEDFALPSRRAALAACRAAMGSGPVLLTGAAGVGKTSLGRLLASEGRFAWVAVDLAPGMTPAELWRTVLAALGVRGPEGPPRIALAEALAERSADGRPVALIADEAHGASDAVLEEIRLQSNRLGRPDGFAAMVICGQTPLARRLESRALAGLESRLAARVHLLPLDEREAAAWLERRLAGRAPTPEQVEDLRRESGGIPALLDRLAIRMAAAPAAPPPVAPARAAIEAAARDEDEPAEVASPPPILPSKPPLRVEEGMIEVGWDAEPEASGDEAATSEPDDEPVDDRYAALQAWQEWVENQGRAPARTSPPEEIAGALAIDDLEPEDEEDASPLDATPGVWADGGQGFGPYSQLFSRPRPLKEAE